MILKMQTVGDEGWAYIEGIRRCRVLRCIVAEPDAMGKEGGPILIYPDGHVDDNGEPVELWGDIIHPSRQVNFPQSEFDRRIAKDDLEHVRHREQNRDYPRTCPVEDIHAYLIEFWMKADDPDMGPSTSVLCNTRLFLTDDEGQTIDRYNKCIHCD